MNEIKEKAVHIGWPFLAVQTARRTVSQIMVKRRVELLVLSRRRWLFYLVITFRAFVDACNMFQADWSDLVKYREWGYLLEQEIKQQDTVEGQNHITIEVAILTAFLFI